MTLNQVFLKNYYGKIIRLKLNKSSGEKSEIYSEYFRIPSTNYLRAWKFDDLKPGEYEAVWSNYDATIAKAKIQIMTPKVLNETEVEELNNFPFIE